MTRDLSNAYLAAIVEASDDAIISKDFQGVIRSWNAAAEGMFGYAPSEIIGRSVTVLIPAERQDEEMAILTRIRNGERVDHFETVRVRKDGTRLDISLTISPIRESSHRIIGASKTARDITAQKRAAANLAEQEQWFRITLNGIGDGVIASDHHGRVTFLNREAERLTGFPLAEARGKPLSDVFSIVNEQSRKRVDNPAARVLQSGRVVGMANHTTLISRDGTEWPISDSAAPIVDPK